MISAQDEPGVDENRPGFEALDQIQSLYDRGLMLQAFALAQAIGPLKEWQGSATTLAGRLASNLGAVRLGTVLHWRAWRRAKDNPDLAAYHAHGLLHRRGPLAAWEFLERFGQPHTDVPPDSLGHFFSVRATMSGWLRDFAAAQQWLAKAREAAPDHPWVAVTESHLLEQQDRYPEALAAARRSLELRPWYRPGVQSTAHALQTLDRNVEALAFLGEAVEHIENFHVVRQMVLLQIELGHYEEASAGLVRCEELAPLMERQEREWLLRQRVTLACLREDFSAALQTAREIDDPYYRELTARLQAGGHRRRARVAVPFVRQHHLTCAPATLSAISRHWNRPAEHLEVAEAICYDGTPAHSERQWAQDNGWHAREFTVTWEAAMALLDRGVPFTLTTSEATSAHLQAVVGYDELRRTLWIRDPFVYYTNEFGIDSLLKRYHASGPRGMVLVPEGRRVLLDGVALPDAELYDQLHELQRALSQHRRADAMRVCEAMQAAAPAHRLTLTARRSLASYDGNVPALLQCLEELLEQFPDDGNLNLARLSCLRELARRKDRLASLEPLMHQRGVDPIFWQQYACELRSDARELEAAATWVNWALRYRSTDPDLIQTRADLLWDQRRFDAAIKYYHLAACLGERREHFARSYFSASRHLRLAESGLEFLRVRNDRLGAGSASPTITFVEALQQLGRTHEALIALDAALERRREDGPLILFAADFNGRCSQFDRAHALLHAARGRCSAAAWARTAASLADYQSEKAAALQHWRAVLALEPLAHDAIRSVATLLAETESREAALLFLDELCARFPFSCPLLTLRVEWLRSDGARAMIAPLRQLLEVNPADAWAWRELALQLAEAGQPDEATQAVEEAIRLEPHRSQGYCTRADLSMRQDEIDSARTDLREAVRLEVDNSYAVQRYVASAPTLAERKTALAEIAEELRRQVIFSEALFAYRDAARGVLAPPDVLALLRDAHAARPDLWQAWSVLVQQLIDVGEHEEALEVARQATGRFPMLARLWVDLAGAERARLNVPGEIAALEEALVLSPAWTFASRLLAAIHERQNDLAKAREVLERAIVAAPLDPLNHGCLAQVLWKLDEREEALTRVQHAVRIEPGYDWAWNALRHWSLEIGQPGLAADTARDLTQRRAGEARSWLMLANSLATPEASTEIMAALDRALELNPRCEEAFDQRAYQLTQLNRFEEALTQCAPPVFQSTPVRLRVRAAWIEAQRGNLARAIALANEALAEHPEYYAGWQLLSEWCIRLQQGDEAIRAAEQMAALAPMEPVPLGYLGDLKQRFNDSPGAKAAFHRAFALDPDYEYAGFQLFQIQLADKEFEDAARTLAVLSRRGEDYRSRTCSIRLASARGEAERAEELFRELSEDRQATDFSFELAASALERCLSRRAVDRLIEQRLSRPSPPPALAEVWVDRQISRNRWSLHSRLSTLQADAETGRRAVLRYLDQLGRTYQRAREKQDILLPSRLRFHFQRLMKMHKAWLRRDIHGWGKVGYVLAVMGRPRPVVEWLSDWRHRPDAESWMLHNLVVMLHRSKRYDEAFEVIRHAVALRHGDDLFEVFTVWAAFEEAIRGNLAKVEQHLKAFPADRVNEHRRPVQLMTQLLIELKRAAGQDRLTLFKTTRTILRSAFSGRRPFAAEPFSREAYSRLMLEVARDLGGIGPRLWGYWFYRGSDWCWLPVLIIAAPIAVAFPPLIVLWWVLFRRFRGH